MSASTTPTTRTGLTECVPCRALKNLRPQLGKLTKRGHALHPFPGKRASSSSERSTTNSEDKMERVKYTIAVAILCLATGLLVWKKIPRAPLARVKGSGGYDVKSLLTQILLNSTQEWAEEPCVLTFNKTHLLQNKKGNMTLDNIVLESNWKLTLGNFTVERKEPADQLKLTFDVDTMSLKADYDYKRHVRKALKTNHKFGKVEAYVLPVSFVMTLLHMREPTPETTFHTLEGTPIERNAIIPTSLEHIKGKLKYRQMVLLKSTLADFFQTASLKFLEDTIVEFLKQQA